MAVWRGEVTKRRCGMTKKRRICLVFDDWRQVGNPNSIYNSELGIQLSSGDLHSGTMLEAEISFSDEQIEKEIIEACEGHGAYPVFSLFLQARPLNPEKADRTREVN